MKKSVIVLSLLIAFGASAAIPVPQSTGYITDTTGSLTSPAKAELTAKARNIFETTKTVAPTLMVESTAGESIDDFAMRVAEAWHPGTAGIDQGVVLVIAKSDKKWAVKTTRNTGRTLTDIQTKQVLEKMKQHLKSNPGDFGGAVATYYTTIAPLVAPIPGDTIAVAASAVPEADYQLMLWLLLAGVPIVFGIGYFAWTKYRDQKEKELLEEERKKRAARQIELNARMERINRETREAAREREAAVVANPLFYQPAPKSSYTASAPPPPKRRESSTTYMPVPVPVDNSWSRSSSSWSSSSDPSSYDGGGSSGSFE